MEVEAAALGKVGAEAAAAARWVRAPAEESKKAAGVIGGGNGCGGRAGIGWWLVARKTDERQLVG